MQSSRIARRDKKAFLSEQCKEIEEEWERLESFSGKLKIPQAISCKVGHNKGQEQ